MIMKAILFCRVSSREQEENGYSLPSQEKLLKSYAEKHDFKVAKIFAISESASTSKQRQIFMTMMRYVMSEDIKIIVCEKVDRLTRNFRDAVSIDDWLDKDGEREVHLVKDSLVMHRNSRSQEKLNWGIRIIMAKNYVDNLSEEVKKGQAEKLSSGWLPTKPPPGYKIVGEDGHKIHVPDEQAPLAVKMFEYYDSGLYAVERLADKMYEEGLRNDRGTRISKSRMFEILRNPFYIGINYWSGKFYPGKQEQIISKELFDRVQARLNRKQTPKYQKHFYLFRALVTCSGCGGTVAWEIQRGKIYGRCNHYRPCDQKKCVREDDAEQKAVEAFEGLLLQNPRVSEWISKALKEIHRERDAEHNMTQSRLNQRLEQINRRLSVLYDDKVDGKISPDFYDNKFEEYTAEKDNVIESIKSFSDSVNKYYQLGSTIYDLAQRGREIYFAAKDRGATDKQRRLFTRVFAGMRLEGDTIVPEYRPEYQAIRKFVLATMECSKMLKDEDFHEIIFEQTKKANLQVCDQQTNLSRSVWRTRPDSNRRSPP